MSSRTAPPEEDDEFDDAIDFSNAQLYLGAFQTITATVLSSVVCVFSCVVLPAAYVSAVRTIVLASTTAWLLVRRPISIGQVHGQAVVFSALRPAVALYLASQILEQLVHTCAAERETPSWRRLVAHGCFFVAMLSGFARARTPLASTDKPFLVTAVALFVVALLPPPPIVFSGPLCSHPSLAMAAERLTRALVFSLVYSVFVYSSAPPVSSSAEILVCVMRASAASIWVLGCHLWLLPAALVQIGIVIHVRVNGTEACLHELLPIMTTEDSDFGDEFEKDDASKPSVESPRAPTPVAATPVASSPPPAAPPAPPAPPVAQVAPAPPPPLPPPQQQPQQQPAVPVAPVAPIAQIAPIALSVDSVIQPSFSNLGPRSLAVIEAGVSEPISASRMAAIAANLPEDE